MELVYPSTIPGPQLAPMDPSERRNLTDGYGPREERAFQRDYHLTQRLQFKFTPAQMAVFNVFIETTLIMGGCWFASSWRTPAGGIGVHRFVMNTKQETFLATGHWLVTIDCEVRGRGMLPVTSSPPAVDGFVSAAVNGIGEVADGDLVVLFFVSGVAPLSAPTGWAIQSQQADYYAHYFQTFTSIFSASNAAANTTNFPTGGGYFITAVYRGFTGLVQAAGTLGDDFGVDVSSPALTNPTGSDSVLLAISSSRQPGVTQSSTSGMDQVIVADTGNFHAVLWAQSGVQSGTRLFHRSAGGFNYTARAIEIA